MHLIRPLPLYNILLSVYVALGWAVTRLILLAL